MHSTFTTQVEFGEIRMRHSLVVVCLVLSQTNGREEAKDDADGGGMDPSAAAPILLGLFRFQRSQQQALGAAAGWGVIPQH
jgi:hypothetical protein